MVFADRSAGIRWAAAMSHKVSPAATMCSPGPTLCPGAALDGPPLSQGGRGAADRRWMGRASTGSRPPAEQRSAAALRTMGAGSPTVGRGPDGPGM